MRYKPRGWVRESWRHGLAAKGIKTNYYAAKSKLKDVRNTVRSEAEQEALRRAMEKGRKQGQKEATRRLGGRIERVYDEETGEWLTRGELAKETQIRRLKATKQLEELRQEMARAQAPVERALAEIRAGRFNTVVAGKKVLDYVASPVDVDAKGNVVEMDPSKQAIATQTLRAAMKEYVIQKTREGAYVPIEAVRAADAWDEVNALRESMTVNDYLAQTSSGPLSQTVLNKLDYDVRAGTLTEEQANRIRRVNQQKIGEQAIESAKAGLSVDEKGLTAEQRAEYEQTVEARRLARAVESAKAGVRVSETEKMMLSDEQKSMVADVERQRKVDRILQQEQAGFKVADADIKALGPDMMLRVKAIRKDLDEELHPMRTEALNIASEKSREALKGIGKGVGKLGSWIKDTYKAEPEGTFGDYEVKKGFMERLDEFAESPIFSNNAFLDEPGQPGYNKEEGSLNFWKADVPQADNIYDNIKTEPLPKKMKKTEREPLQDSPLGFAFGASQIDSQDDVQKKVDSIHEDRFTLAEADTSAYKRGTENFKKGNREGLISSIIDLEREEARLKDNWQAVENIRQQVKDPVNIEVAFTKEKSFFSSGGAAKIADQNKKVSEVKEKLMKSFSEVNSRKKMLQQRRQQLDANAKPEVGAPQSVKVFDGDAEGTFMDAFKRPLEVAKSVYDAGGAQHVPTKQHDRLKVHWKVEKSDFNSIRKSLARISPAVKAPQEQRPWVR